MKLTKKQAVKEHRKMWNWIADETERQKRKVSKEDYFNAHPEYEMRPLLDCFCCEYDDQHELRNCRYCPVLWNTENHRCYWNGTVFGSWGSTESCEWNNAALYAREIANLPEREGNV